MVFISILTLDTLVIYNVIHLDGANLYNFNNNNNNNGNFIEIIYEYIQL